MKSRDANRSHNPAQGIYRILVRADLQGLNLSGVDFTCAVLTYANLQGAQLEGSSLAYAFLGGADLRGATGLIEASVEGAQWDGTYCLDGTDSSSKGGSCVGHLSPGDGSRAEVQSRACEGGDAKACNLAGALLPWQQSTRAASAFAQACQAGEARSCTSLGDAYRFGVYRALDHERPGAGTTISPRSAPSLPRFHG